MLIQFSGETCCYKNTWSSRSHFNRKETMDSAVMLESICPSTPPRRRPLCLPIAPIKKSPTRFQRRLFDISPSKACRSISAAIQNDLIKATDIPDLSTPFPRAIGFHSCYGGKKMDGDELYSPLASESDNTLNSENSSLSSLSDSSSAPSLSPEFDKFSFLDPCTVSASSELTAATLEFNQLLSSSINSVPLKKTSVPVSGQHPKHEPCHRIKKPSRSILRLHSGSLNLLVSSSRGSLEDATIFATEINASLSGNDKLPSIKNAHERVIIPVNTTIKNRHKKRKQSLMGPDYVSDSESDGRGEEETLEAAYISGFECESSQGEKVDFHKGLDCIKRVQWAGSMVL